jgi:Uma2 family endonuclease
MHVALIRCPVQFHARLPWRGADLLYAAEEPDIMAMPGVPAVTTIEGLLALPEDGRRHELLDGAHVVTPAPQYDHQSVLARLLLVLARALEGVAGLEVLWSPADIVLGPRTLVQPDLFVIRQHPGRPIKRWADVGVPVLAVEILSPGTAARDRGAKRRIYQQAGVAEYWIVDLDARLVERWRPQDERPEIISAEVVWEPESGTTARIELGALFN